MEPNTNQNTAIPSSEETIDLDKLAKGTFVEAGPQETAISRLNAQESVQMVAPTIDLEKFDVPEVEAEAPKVVLGDSGILTDANKKVPRFSYWKLLMISMMSIAVFGIAALILGTYNNYLTLSAQPVIDLANIAYVEDYKSAQDFLRTTLGLSTYQRYSALGMQGTMAKSNIKTILQAPELNYVAKKEILQNALNQFSPVLIGNKQRLESLKQEVTKYGFFSQELYDLLQNEEYVTSIKESLLSLEMIKFGSAIKVFSYLDTFVATIANVFGIPSTTAATKMTALADRGETDIALYLNNCYLNPYEIDYQCNLVGDFDRYYNVIAKNSSGLDIPFFKKIMSLIDIKLEQTSLPSFAITFQKFDPTQKQISFKVDVNTFQQDEAALTKKGIINPHIFIVTNLLNLIKQSLYVLSENIDAKTLKIIPKTIQIGTTSFTVNNSTMNFILPIQKSTQREISDYTSKSLLDIIQQ